MGDNASDALPTLQPELTTLDSAGNFVDVLAGGDEPQAPGLTTLYRVPDDESGEPSDTSLACAQVFGGQRDLAASCGRGGMQTASIYESASTPVAAQTATSCVVRRSPRAAEGVDVGSDELSADEEPSVASVASAQVFGDQRDLAASGGRGGAQTAPIYESASTPVAAQTATSCVVRRSPRAATDADVGSDERSADATSTSGPRSDESGARAQVFGSQRDSLASGGRGGTSATPVYESASTPGAAQTVPSCVLGRLPRTAAEAAEGGNAVQESPALSALETSESFSWRRDGEELELRPAQQEEWALRLHGHAVFDASDGQRRFLGCGGAGPAAVAHAVQLFRRTAGWERRVGSGNVSGFLMLPVVPTLPLSLWRLLDGFHVVAVLTDSDAVYTRGPSLEADVDAAVVLALYWPSAAELQSTDRRGERNPWWTDAPQLTGERRLDITRIRQAHQEAVALPDPLVEARALLSMALSAAGRPESERVAVRECARDEPLESMFWRAECGRKPKLMAFDAVLINQRRGRLLVDTGADHNHGSARVAERCGWLVHPLPEAEWLRVRLADGSTIFCKSTAVVTVRFHSFQTRVTLYLLPDLPGFDVVLGGGWLEEQERRAGVPWTFSFVNKYIELAAPHRPLIRLDARDRTAATWFERHDTAMPMTTSHTDLRRGFSDGDELYMVHWRDDGIAAVEPVLEMTDSVATAADFDAEDVSTADDFFMALQSRLEQPANAAAPAKHRGPRHDELLPAPRGDGRLTAEVIVWDDARERFLLRRDANGRAWLPSKQLIDLAISDDTGRADIGRWEAARAANTAAGASIAARDCQLISERELAQGWHRQIFSCTAPATVAIPPEYFFSTPTSVGDFGSPPLSQPERAPELMAALAHAYARSGGGVALSDEERADDALMGDVPDEKPPEVDFLVDGGAERVKALESEFGDILCEKDNLELPPRRGEFDFAIDTDPADGVRCASVRKLSPDGMRELSEQLRIMQKVGLARPSSSPWGAPVLFAPKKDGSSRLCFDYRELNELVKRRNGGLDSYAMPDEDTLRHQFTDARVFSTMDALAGYWQIRIKEEDIPKTAVRTPLGSFEMLVMGFGHARAPAHFQKWMAHVLAPFLHRFAVVFIDDVCIYSRTVEEHQEHLRLVMERMRELQVKLRRSKCRFYQAQVEFLGHRIGAGVVTPVQDKLAAVRQWPQPVTKKQLRGFLGLSGYYCDFIQGYSEMAAPLTNLSRDEADVVSDWDESCTRAFERMKLALTSAPVLRLADSSKPYLVYVDASETAVGAVLMQRDDDGRPHPVAFYSKKLSRAESRYGATARELLGLVLSLRRWRHYLMGSEGVELWTDCKPLTWLQTQSAQTLQPMHVRWLELFAQFPLQL